jgi:putative copper resistance protein D
MEPAPGLGEVVRAWVLSPAWLILIPAALACYVRGFLAARRSGSPHPAWRLAAFCAGLAVLALAVFSPIAAFSGELLWVDFTGFLFITMIAPPLILLGAPLTLAFRAAGRNGRTRLRRIYRSRMVTVVTFPVATWLTFAVVTYVWQFSSLTELAARSEVARLLQQTSLLFVGLLFWLPGLAADPLRWRMAYPLRALYIFVEMTHKSLFGGMFLSMNTPFHEHFAARAPSWAPGAMTDQRIAILILWIGGNLVFLAALIGVVARWIAYEQRNQHRVDLRLALQREKRRRKAAALEQVFTKGV